MSVHHRQPHADAPCAALQKDRHIRYWLRCLRSFLPTEYTSNDSNRMTLAFFIISALDLLGVVQTHIPPAERQGYIDWIYHCQHADGGFRGSPATLLGARASKENARWDRASLPNTYFAIVTLAILGDGMQRVRRRACLAWLVRLQRENGCFDAELEEEEDGVRRERDMRFCYWAAGLRWLLKGGGEIDPGYDIDVDGLVRYINASESYDHGFSEAPYLEAHAGLSYCAIAALAFLDRLPDAVRGGAEQIRPVNQQSGPRSVLTGISCLDGTVRWLVSRQNITEDDADESAGSEVHAAAPGQVYQPHELPHQVPSSSSSSSFLHEASSSESLEPLSDRPEVIIPAGFNGRCNKMVDTCYSFWVGASLKILNSLPLINIPANRHFLLAHTQHPILGGFGKAPGDLPDVLHSYLGLAALGILPPAPTTTTTTSQDGDQDGDGHVGEDGVKLVDPMAGVARNVRRTVERWQWGDIDQVRG